MKEKKEKRVTVSARVKKEIKERSEKKAEGENRTLSNVIETRLAEYIKKP